MGSFDWNIENMRPTLDLLEEQFGILPSDLTKLSAAVGISDPAVRVELGMVLRRNVPPEQLRERASRLLATANRLEQERAGAERPSFDAFSSGTVYVPPGVDAEEYLSKIRSAEQ